MKSFLDRYTTHKPLARYLISLSFVCIMSAILPQVTQVSADSDLAINRRLITLQNVICRGIEDSNTRTMCYRLARPFLPKANVFWSVTRVVDGDTVMLKYSGDEIKVRLL